MAHWSQRVRSRILRFWPHFASDLVHDAKAANGDLAAG